MKTWKKGGRGVTEFPSLCSVLPNKSSHLTAELSCDVNIIMFT